MKTEAAQLEKLPESKPGMFVTEDGKNHLVTFILVSTLFLLWGFCNGMIDVMDKHFQEELHLTLSQSAWVQFAHYLGYFLMAMPAGWLASKLGYRGGIIAGLLMVAVGGFWFIPATRIAAFWAFLLGVCLIASGLTFLETVANPYTTVLGSKLYAATRINLAQSCNGIGWLFGPVAGAMFFYSTDAQGNSTGSATLWIPYACVAVVVLILAVIFSRVEIPDIKTEDDYHLDTPISGTASVTPECEVGPNSLFALSLLWLNLAILSTAIGMIFSAIASIFISDSLSVFRISSGVAITLLFLFTVVLIVRKNSLTRHSLWSHLHFSSATIAQFFYVAAQSGIFAYFINYITSQAPLPIGNKTASMLATVAFGFFLAGRFIGAVLLKKFSASTILGVFAAANVMTCSLIFFKLEWVSLVSLFLSYFFMSIMFPTIFALGIHGLGSRAKKASSFLVMAIMGGAIMPKLMGLIADHSDMSRGYIVPLFCFVLIAIYAFSWPTLSGARSK